MQIPPEYDLGRPVHVLLVDDTPMNLTIMKACCDLFGVTHECARDGLEAVSAVATCTFDAILMDVRMPNMDGVQATQAIACMPAPICEVPIIAVTGDVTDENRRKCLISGMRAVIEKPIRIELLFRALRDVIPAETVKLDVA